jgi:phytoene dehydrogenase-like protein
LKAKKPTSTSKLYAKSIAEKWSVWRLQDGLQTLVEAFESKLISNGVEIRKNVKVEGMILQQK